MFGHDDNQAGQQLPADPAAGQDQFMGAQLQVPPMPASDQSQDGMAPTDTAVPSVPSTDTADSSVAPSPGPDISAPTDVPAADTSTGAGMPTPDEPNVASDTANNDESLMSIKKQALDQLAPLVDHLEQSPEEEFRTTMMMIQASDNKALVQKAYDAAQKITDEKTKAQALLDVVNEINYFTQSKKD